MTAPFWIDWDYDRANANIGSTSRYGDYLNTRDRAFAELWREDQTAEFAALAWRIATGPIMVPPLVRHHPRISAVSLQVSDWNGNLIADVRLRTPRPHALNGVRPADGTWFRDQDPDSSGEYEIITEHDLESSAYLVTVAQLVWQIPAGELPPITEAIALGPDRYDAAVTAVKALIRELNAQLTPVIDALGNG